MTQRKYKKQASVAGFTLIEMLVAVALMGVALAALGVIIAQWLPNWSLGFARVQRSELVSISLDRIVGDLGAAEFVTQDRDTKLPLFSGTEREVTFIRTAYGPNTAHGLEVVRIAETADSKGALLARSTATYAPGRPMTFTNPVVLLRAPFQVSFSYQGRDGTWKNAWQGEAVLPTMVRLTVRDSATARALAISTAAVVHVDLPATCVRSNSKRECDDLTKKAAGTAGTANNPSPQSTNGSLQNASRGG
jgi:general secretion pathway protein J